MALSITTYANSYVFQPPNPSTYTTSAVQGHFPLLHIPLLDRKTLKPIGRAVHAILHLHDEAKFLVIYAHPNAVDIGQVGVDLKKLSEASKVNVLAFEYTGYGLGLGRPPPPSEEETYLNVSSAYFFARSVLKVPRSAIVLVGRSLGSAVVAYLAANLPGPEVEQRLDVLAGASPPPPSPSPGGAAPPLSSSDLPGLPLVVLQCPFTSIVDCATYATHWVGGIVAKGALGGDILNTRDRILKIRCPIAFHHGKEDRLVPYEHSRQMFEDRAKAAIPLTSYAYYEEGRAHNNLSRHCLERILEERLSDDGRPALNTQYPQWMAANHPLFSNYFPLSAAPQRSTAGGAAYSGRMIIPGHEFTAPCMQRLVDNIRGTCYLVDYVSDRARIAELLTLGATFFAMRCRMEWDLATNYATYQPPQRWTVENPRSMLELGPKGFVLSCMARWGSPLGIHLARFAGEPDLQRVVFGALVREQDAADAALDLRYYRSKFMGFFAANRIPLTREHLEVIYTATVAELPCSDALLRAIINVLAVPPSGPATPRTLGSVATTWFGGLTGIFSFPGVDSTDDRLMVLSRDLVTDIQSECERTVAALTHTEWAAWEQLLYDAFPALAALVVGRSTGEPQTAEVPAKGAHPSLIYRLSPPCQDLLATMAALYDPAPPKQHTDPNEVPTEDRDGHHLDRDASGLSLLAKQRTHTSRHRRDPLAVETADTLVADLNSLYPLLCQVPEDAAGQRHRIALLRSMQGIWDEKLLKLRLVLCRWPHEGHHDVNLLSSVRDNDDAFATALYLMWRRHANPRLIRTGTEAAEQHIPLSERPASRLAFGFLAVYVFVSFPALPLISSEGCASWKR
eukprot:gene2123-1299_t